ncbi:MAG: family 10 glycosylhydrolase [Gemmatimonadota bacterium]
MSIWGRGTDDRSVYGIGLRDDVMKRREFVRVAAGGVAAATLPLDTMGCAGPRTGETPSDFLLWTWVHGGGDRSPSEWQAQYGLLAEEGFHGVLVGGGDTAVHAEAAHAAGLEFHRWVWTLNRNGDEWVKANRPEWFTVSRNGESSLTHPPYVGYYKWLCPTRPEVREYLRDSMLKIAREPGVDGVHLDYVRHCDVILPSGLWAKYDLVQDREYPDFDFCYCDVCRESFASAHNTDPLALEDPTANEAWRRFRWDSVTGLVRVLADAIHEEGQPITAAVFPTPSIARRLVRQAWDEWPVDAVFPMLYHSFYEEGLDWIGRGVEEGLAALASRTSWVDANLGSGPPQHQKLYAGLYLPALSEEERRQAVEIARNAGAHGVSFFEMNGLLT